MKSLLLVINLALLSLNCVSAQIVTDPIQNYLTSRDVDRDTAMPDLQKLFVIKCDLTHGGKPSVLISFNSYGGQQGNYWTAYIPTDNGYEKADDSGTTLIFNPNLFYVGWVKGKYGLLSYAPGKDGGDLNLYQIVNGRVTKAKIGSIDLSKPNDMKELDGYFGQPSNWKSHKDHPMTTKNLDDLRGAGYDVDGAIRAAKAAAGSH